MLYQVTYVPTGDTLYSGSEFKAFCAVDSLCYIRGIDFPHELAEDFWLLLHDFPADVTVSFGDFAISSDSGNYDKII